MYIKVKGHPDLRKDSVTGAILKVDKESIRRHAHHIQGVELEQVRDQRIDKLETDIADIKRMLIQILGSK